ncbi:hypothetical protein [Microbacterium sp. KR10-403]|uniref:hypothetical protein n=1 Tax=Microbacterium sp. KR10-403 TaxID=3158581 RepID=UPI0032E3B397
MAKFHVTKAGKTEPCGATVRACPLGEANHFASLEEAVAHSMAGEASSPYSEWDVANAQQLVNDYGLYENRPISEERVIAVAGLHGVPAELLLSEVARAQEAEARESQEFQERYDERVAEVTATTPAKLRRGLVVAVKDGDSARLMKIESARAGHLYGPSVGDGDRFEPIYFDGVPASSVLRPEPQLTMDENWHREPGEAPLKKLRDSEGTIRGSVQLREGVYILGARVESTRRLILFEKSNFDTVEEAMSYFQAWSKENPTVVTTA